MTDHPALSATYPIARAAFRAAADAAGATVHTFEHPLRGPEGESLGIDVAELGPRDAATVVLVVSATHGVEGYCGSALQTQWLTHHAGERPHQLRLVNIHALNPYGMAWVRRVNEDNVDLNRNFVDWSQPAPSNADYDGIADLVVPAEWTADEQQRTLEALLALVAEWGFPKVQAVVSGGQYAHPKGVFYGGTGPVWSHRWLRSWSWPRDRTSSSRRSTRQPPSGGFSVSSCCPPRRCSGGPQRPSSPASWRPSQPFA